MASSSSSHLQQSSVSSSSQEEHLQETELTGAVTQKALELLAEWVKQEAKFVPQGENATIKDLDFAVFCQPLFNNISKQKGTPRRSSNVIRVRAPIVLNHSDADLVPLRITSGHPTIGGKVAVIGRTIHIKEPVQVTAGLDLLSLFAPDTEPSVKGGDREQPTPAREETKSPPQS